MEIRKLIDRWVHKTKDRDLKMSPTEARETIRYIDMKRELLRGRIEDIAKANIPDYCFLDYEVSTFWKCEQSPIGMCVFVLDWETYGRRVVDDCRYCYQPEERK